MRTAAAINAFMSDPESEIRNLSGDDRNALYSQAWRYYRSSQFSRRNSESWKVYLADRELYKHTRLIFNPVPQIVDFYVDNLWQSARNENFESLVTPVSDKTDEPIIKAIAQLDQWGNFLSESQKMKRYGAATGNVLIEGIDDPLREKITHRTIWAGYVKDIELNDSGDVLAYTIEYDVLDKSTNKTYKYRKEVTKETFSYFRDDSPFTPDGRTASVEENPYGFCFAVWIKQIDDGGIYGLPACHTLDKVDDVNSNWSAAIDSIPRDINSGKIISGIENPSTDVKVLTGATENKDGTINEIDPRLHRVLLAVKGNAQVGDLAGDVKLLDAYPLLRDYILSFGDDYPEIEYKQIMKENGQLSGRALERLLTPAQNRLNGVQPHWNQQLIKFRQMGCAVTGWRLRNGWTQKTAQQRLFGDFDLKSYEQGKLDFYLKPSVLVQVSEDEREELLKKKADRAAVLKDGVDEQEYLEIAGYSEEKAKEIKQRKSLEAPKLPPNQPNFVLPNRPPMQLGDGAN